MPLIIVRHGQSTANAERIYSGQLDHALTPQGLEEARQAGQLLLDWSFDVVVTSPLQRAIVTANLILCENPDAAPQDWIRTHTLAERYEGDIEGLPRAFARMRFGGEHCDRAEAVLDYHVAGGETLQDVLNRVTCYHDQVLLPLSEAGRNVLVVCHAWVARALLVCHRHLDPAILPKIAMPNGAVVTDATALTLLD